MSLFPRYHPSLAEDRRSHLRQHVGQRRSEDGGDHHLRPRGGRPGLHHAHGAKEETEGAETEETQRWVEHQIMVYFGRSPSHEVENAHHLKGQFTSKSKIDSFPLTCSAIYQSR